VCSSDLSGDEFVMIVKEFEYQPFLERLAMLLSTSTTQEMPLLLGVSSAAKRVDTLALQAARQDRPVMIVGGPGTGKALVARRIHEASERRAAPFVAVNLAREADARAALFDPNGAWARVGEGVLFLNALSYLPETGHADLLEAMAAGFSGRIIAACGKEMAEIIGQNDAKSDFFYRLDMMEIPIPPLGSRSEDAFWLMQQLFAPLNEARLHRLLGISQLCESVARTHDWPGGGREVRARLQKGVENATGPLLQPVDMFPESMVNPTDMPTLAETRETAEKMRIIEALALTDGQISKAAASLRVSRTTLWEKMQKFGIDTKGE